MVFLLTVKEDFILKALNKSDQNYDSAVFATEKGYYDAAISSIYYSAFQTLSAYILFKEKDELLKSHKAVKAFFNKEIVQLGLVDLSLGKFYNKLEDYRILGDYIFNESMPGELCKENLKTLKDFNNAVRSLIEFDKNILESRSFIE